MRLSMPRTTAALFFVVISAVSQAADLDVPSARARYESQKRAAEAARSRFDAQAQILREAENRLNAASQYEANARATLRGKQEDLRRIDSNLSTIQREINQVLTQLEQTRNSIGNQERLTSDLERQRSGLQAKCDNLDQRIRQIRRRIQDLENGVSNQPWVCVWVDQGFEEHAGGHRGRDKDRARAAQEAEKACLAVHGKCRSKGCDQVDGPELADLRRRLEQAQTERNEAANQLASVDSQLNQARNELSRLQAQLASQNSELRDKQFRISSLERDRSRAERDIDTAQREVERTVEATRQARRDVDTARVPFNETKSESEREQRLADQAYAYLQQVIANYDAALNEIYRKADLAGREHARQEAEQRAPDKGRLDGALIAREKASAKGSADVSQRDLRKGYLEGRAKGATQLALSEPYRRGIELGKSLAVRKAASEDFPLGYNDALAKLVSSTPAAAETIDITESISSSSGGGGEEIPLDKKTSIPAVGPSAKEPAAPDLAPPAYSAPVVGVPPALKAQYQPPCSGLELPEFVPMCESRYDATYSAAFGSAYRSVYLASFQASYSDQAPKAYAISLGEEAAAALATGRSAGAADQGALDGFASSLPVAKSDQYAQGQTAFERVAASRSLVSLVSASLSETSGDRLFTPGENAILTIVLDNRGGDASARAKLRLRLKGTQGLGAAKFEVRELPALSGRTRTTLVGVTAVPITTDVAGEKIALTAVLEAERSGGWKTVGEIGADGVVSFPLELTDIQLPKTPQVDEAITATLTYANRTDKVIDATKMEFYSSPGFVVVDKPEVEVAKVEPGASVTAKVDVKPGPWVGDNTHVRFVSRKAGEAASAQAFPKFLKVERPVSLLLFDSSGKAVAESKIRVKPGGWASFSTRLAFLAKSYLPGPFVLRVAKVSDPSIQAANGSTVSVNYGSLSPGTSLSSVGFNYLVPAKLAGTEQYILIQAEEGGKVRHALMVYLDIR